MDPRKTDATDEVYPVKDMPQLHKKMGRDVSESSPGSIVDYFDTMEATMNGLVKSDRLKKFYVVEHLGDWVSGTKSGRKATQPEGDPKSS